MSTTVDLGKISLTPMNEYVHGTQYEKLDLVTYQRGLFIAKENNQNILPTVTATWMKIGDFSEGAIMTDSVNGVGHPDGQTITVDADGTFSATCKVVYVTEVPTASNATKNTLYIKGSSADGYSIYTLIGTTVENVSKMVPKYAGSSSAGGSATSAVKLQTARTIRTNLASTSSASFNGTANVTPGVTGVLPVANGGTGTDTLSGAYNALINSKNYYGDQTIYDEDRLTIEHEEVEDNFNIVRTSFARVWEFIKSHIADIFGLYSDTLTKPNIEKSLIGSLDTDYTYYTSDNKNSCFLPSLEDTGNGRVIKKRPISSIIGLLGSVGSATRPVYFQYGYPVQCDYTLNKSVPSDAKFTDTTYSAATTSATGLMSATDKIKLDRIACKEITMFSLGLNGKTSSVADFFNALNIKGYDANYGVLYFAYDNARAGSITGSGITISINGCQCIITNHGPAPWQRRNAIISIRDKTYNVWAQYDYNSTPSESGIVDISANTWRPVQNNLTSTSTSDCLSANQGRILKGLIDEKPIKVVGDDYRRETANVAHGGAIISTSLSTGTYFIFIYLSNNSTGGGWFGLNGAGITDATNYAYGTVNPGSTIAKPITVSGTQTVGLWNLTGGTKSYGRGTYIIYLKV